MIQPPQPKVVKEEPPVVKEEPTVVKEEPKVLKEEPLKTTVRFGLKSSSKFHEDQSKSL